MNDLKKLQRANLEIANKILTFAQKNSTDVDETIDMKTFSNHRKIALLEDPHKMAMQIDTDIRESLPPQMIAVVQGVMQIFNDLNIS